MKNAANLLKISLIPMFIISVMLVFTGCKKDQSPVPCVHTYLMTAKINESDWAAGSTSGALIFFGEDTACTLIGFGLNDNSLCRIHVTSNNPGTCITEASFWAIDSLPCYIDFVPVYSTFTSNPIVYASQHGSGWVTVTSYTSNEQQDYISGKFAGTVYIVGNYSTDSIIISKGEFINVPLY